jgi:hypothetical protein
MLRDYMWCHKASKLLDNCLGINNAPYLIVITIASHQLSYLQRQFVAIILKYDLNFVSLTRAGKSYAYCKLLYIL